MTIIARFLRWAAVFAVLTLVFWAFAPSEAGAVDSETVLTVLTDDGPVVTTMEEYLPHAVAGEMPASFGAEALKAQAVAARTYVLACTRHQEADVCTDSACCLAYSDEQALRDAWGEDYDLYWQAVTEAVAATDGEYLTYEGEAIQAVFHASSAGSTESSGAVWSALPYLVSVASPESSADVPGLITTAAFSPEELAEALGLADAGDDPSEWIGETTLDSAGRVAAIVIGGEALTGTYVRACLGLRSTDFSLSWDGEKFVFTVAGSGHGVGMSQYGAKVYAAQGWTYQEILSHYYPGAVLAVYGG
ncbi:MAG: stage II sporulation protein D [Oscillospiraceae bacterium]|nr:stage II sporulation protein D [Oscillospiraceae bacterium]